MYLYVLILLPDATALQQVILIFHGTALKCQDLARIVKDIF
jgi:hypothetical protein